MKVVIIGGGVSGMFAGISASKNSSNDVIIIEKNEKLGKKLFITGKGRCNVTNNCDSDEFFKNIVHNSKFMYSSFNTFSNMDLMNMIEENGCKLKVERGNRVFPVSDKSYDITDALKRILKKQNVNVMSNTEVIDIKVTNVENEIDNNLLKVKGVECKTKDNKKINIVADKIIIATGGASYKSTGSTGDGYRFAKKLGINVKKISESLVPLIVMENAEAEKLKGLTLKNVKVRFYDNDDKKKRVIYDDFGDIEYKDGKIMGPVIISASSYIDGDKKYDLYIDLKPALTEKTLDDRLLREINENKKMKINYLLEKLLPKIMVGAFFDRLKEKLNKKNIYIDEKIILCDINKEIRESIVDILKNYKYNIVGKASFDEAIITSGGIDVKEINPKTMEAKKVKGLFFAGEVIDVDCLTGGFNIQVAASTGYVAGM